MKFIFEAVTEEDREECKEGLKRVIRRLCRLSSEDCFGNFY